MQRQSGVTGQMANCSGSQRLAIASRLLKNPDREQENHAEDVAQQHALLEQYKIYLDLTDRLANRRNSTNSFFMALNTAAVTAFAAIWMRPPQGLATVWLLVPAFAVLILCLTWFLLIAHYRAISAAKWSIIAAFEELLPAQPSRAEWRGVLNGEGDRRWWRRLTRLEQLVPVVFAILYLVGVILAIFT